MYRTISGLGMKVAAQGVNASLRNRSALARVGGGAPTFAPKANTLAAPCQHVIRGYAGKSFSGDKFDARDCVAHTKVKIASLAQNPGNVGRLSETREQAERASEELIFTVLAKRLVSVDQAESMRTEISEYIAALFVGFDENNIVNLADLKVFGEHAQKEADRWLGVVKAEGVDLLTAKKTLAKQLDVLSQHAKAQGMSPSDCLKAKTSIGQLLQEFKAPS